MPTLPNMALVTPTLNGDSGTWDDKINAALALLDAHDHTSGKGVRIVSAALRINADVSWGDWAITGLGKLAFTAVTALASGSKTLFVSSADNELYWRTNGGTNVKLTSGTSINTTLVGGIVGDYSTVGAEVSYSDADQIYTFKDETAPTKKWARIGAGTVRIFEHDTTETVYVELATPVALAAPFTVTFPVALPAGTQILTISSTGQLAIDGVLGANQSITLSGTGRYKHGEFKVPNAGFGGIISVAAGATSTFGDFPHITIGNNGEVWFPIPCMVGKRLKAVEFLEAAAVANVTYTLYFAGVSKAYTASVPSASRLTLDSPITALDNGENTVWLKITTDATGTTEIYSVIAVFDEV